MEPQLSARLSNEPVVQQKRRNGAPDKALHYRYRRADARPATQWEGVSRGTPEALVAKETC